jgi:DNA helicase-2/ATP-dependent DNA helicase PcrA
MMDYKTAAQELRGNPGQRKAYESSGNCVILAGPGSGKTKTLTTKMARMLAEDVHRPSGVACITYSTECARELQKRLGKLGIVEAPNVFIGTVHAFSLKHVVFPFAWLSDLGLPREFSVASVSDQDRIFTLSLKTTIGDENPWNYRGRFERYRRTYLDRVSKEFITVDSEIAGLVVDYEKRLLSESLVDFDSMILWGLQLIERHEWVRKAIKARFPILVVDEYQDLGLTLHRMVLALCQKAGVRLVAVGDPDQSIYGFAGSMPKLLKELAKADWVEPVSLKFNYRCGRRIVAASLTALGEEREYESKVKQQGTIDFYECPEGITQQATVIIDKIIPAVLKQFPGLVVGKIAVLYGDRNDGSVIAAAAQASKMKYVRIDAGAAYRRTPLTRWLEDCAAWCVSGWKSQDHPLSGLIKKWLSFNRAVNSDAERAALRQQLVTFLFAHRAPTLSLREWLGDFYKACLGATLINEPAMRDEAEAFKGLAQATAETKDLANFNIATFSGQGGSPEHLNLITLHSAKGLEFEVVVMMGMDQGRIPRWDASTPEAISEARRLFYVGLTRAKQQIHMTFSGFTEDKYGRRHQHGPSIFMTELQKKLAEESQP